MVGDVTSTEKGSGARYNDGKVPYELLPIAALIENGFGSTDTVIHDLALFQRSGDETHLIDALDRFIITITDLSDCAKVFDYGRQKYAEWNWAKGMPWSVPLGCALRHAFAMDSGEELDPESGLPHLAHLQCNILMLMTYVKTYPEGNNLPIGLV